MTPALTAMPERLEELLVDEATHGLDDRERSELTRLLADHPHVDAEAFDRAAAALAVAEIAAELSPMPAGLRDVVLRSAAAWSAAPSGTAGVLRPAPPAPSGTGRARADASAWRLLPWLAAAAALALAVLAWWPAPPTVNGVMQRVEAAGDAVERPWGSNDLGVTGSVVWSNTAQTGYLRLSGLAANDPGVHQYQLWIVDGRRNPAFNAVDGGVFDVEPGATAVVVPINAKLEVFEPILFAVTTEPPGGVVKHDPALDPERFRMILTAPVKG